MKNIYYTQNDDCPVCGETEGANMGSSAWGHDIPCCSDECGKKLGHMLKDLRSSKEMQNLIHKLAKIKAQINKKVLAIAPNAEWFELKKWSEV